MAYEDDGSIGYILTRTYENGLTVPARQMIYSNREQVQAHANCLTEKAKAAGRGERFGVAGISPLRSVPIPADYSGPHHTLSDDCELDRHE